MMKGLCNVLFRGQDYVRVCLYKRNIQQNPIPTLHHQKQHKLRFQKQDLCLALALRLKFCGLRLVLASSKASTPFCSLKKLQHLQLSLVVPCLLTMWGASKSFHVIICSVNSAMSLKRTTAYSYHSCSLSLSPHHFSTMQTFFWRTLSTLTPPPQRNHY